MLQAVDIEGKKVFRVLLIQNGMKDGEWLKAILKGLSFTDNHQII